MRTISLRDRLQYRFETVVSRGSAALLRKGRSFVVENDHTLILGWSDAIFTILSALVIANENRRCACVVVLAGKDKVEMEDEIRSKLGKTGTTRIVCRTGSPTDLEDLEMVNPDAARSIIILSPTGENPDFQVIKTTLAIVNNRKRKPQPYHIVAEIRESANLEAARMVGKNELEIILAGDLIARVAVQACRQSGLSLVYTELLDFAGNEIYFQEEPKLVGKSFGEALLSYEDSSVIGIRTTEGNILLNPPMSTPFRSGDKVIAITKDDDTLIVSDKMPTLEPSAVRTTTSTSNAPERTLILGWNDRVPLIIRELDSYVASGSDVVLVADVIGAERELDLESKALKNQSCHFIFGDTTSRAVLNQLQLHAFNHILVVSYSERFGVQEADSRTLVTLLHLRQIAEEEGHDYAVVSEMLDVRNRQLAEVTQADDFIVSHKLVSLLMSQISENKELSMVFAELFRADGSELYLKPAQDYVELGKAVSFYTVVEAAKRKNEVAIGYRIRDFATDSEKAFGVTVNPRKSERVTLLAHDKVIVLAEN